MRNSRSKEFPCLVSNKVEKSPFVFVVFDEAEGERKWKVSLKCRCKEKKVFCRSFFFKVDANRRMVRERLRDGRRSPSRRQWIVCWEQQEEWMIWRADESSLEPSCVS